MNKDKENKDTNKKFKNLGSFLKEARVKAGLSQGEVAKRLGYTSPQFISNFERGIASPPCKNLKTLVELYDLQPNQLVQIMYEDQQSALKISMAKLRKHLKSS